MEEKTKEQTWQVTFKGPATIANLGPGFDIFGLCIENPFDLVTVKITTNSAHRIINSSGTEVPLVWE